MSERYTVTRQKNAPTRSALAKTHATASACDGCTAKIAATKNDTNSFRLRSDLSLSFRFRILRLTKYTSKQLT